MFPDFTACSLPSYGAETCSAYWISLCTDLQWEPNGLEEVVGRIISKWRVWNTYQESELLAAEAEEKLSPSQFLLFYSTKGDDDDKGKAHSPFLLVLRL